MSNNFEENNKFFSQEGTINRRTYITNFLIVEILESILYVTPLILILMFNPDIMSEILKSQTEALPRWINIWGLCTILVEISLLYPSIVKRIRDISGNQDNPNWVMLAVIMPLLVYLPVPAIIKQLFSGMSFFIVICLMAMKGKISGERPKSEVAKFNWGAMFGTWIWGLINKSYITLLAIPLFFTTGFIPFMILCGIKGNEWAYESNKKTLEEFHKSQSLQAGIFSAIIPILFIILSIIGLVAGTFALAEYLDKHPTTIKKLESYTEKMIKNTTEARFKQIEFTKDEYKFYLDPVDWKKLPKQSKINLFQVVESYVVMSVDKNYSKEKGIAPYIKEYNKIKIYSTYNNEILAEYYFDEQKYDELTQKFKNKEISAKEYVKSITQGLKLNENPTLP